MGFGKNLKTKLYSGDNLMNLSDVRYLPRWVVLFIDIFFISLAIFFSCYLIEKLSYSTIQVFSHRGLMYLLIPRASIKARLGLVETATRVLQREFGPALSRRVQRAIATAR